MQVLDLVLQIFMAASLISGTIMLVYTISNKHMFKIAERACRYSVSLLLVYSVVIRFIIMMPGKFAYMKETSIGFDLLYIVICVFHSMSLFNRIMDDSERRE